jgi:hypothetical protein
MPAWRRLMLVPLSREPSRVKPKIDAVDTATSVEFIGGEACADCHTDEYPRWTGIHYDHAKQLTDHAGVLADFGGTRFIYDGNTCQFFRRDIFCFVRSDAAYGELAEFEVTHAFGAEPLQQCPLALPAGVSRYGRPYGAVLSPMTRTPRSDLMAACSAGSSSRWPELSSGRDTGRPTSRS